MKTEMKKSKIIPLIACLMASLLTGCSDEANENPPKQEKVSVEEIKDDIEQAMSREYAQFIMDDNVNYTVPTKIMDCTFFTKKDFAQNYESVFLSVTDSEKLNEKYLIKDDDFMGEGYVYDNPEEKKYAAISDSGFVSFFNGVMYNADFSSFPIKQVIVNGSSEWDSDFDFNGMSFSVDKATEICNKWIEEKWVQYEPDLTFKPSHICIINDGKEDIITVTYNKYYNGIKLCECDKSIMPPDIGIYEQIRNSGLIIFITKSGIVEGFTSGLSSLEVKDNEEISEIMSLTSALDFVEYKFSEYNKYDVVGVNLKYILIYESETNASFCDENVSNKVKLVWEILIKPDYPDLKKADISSIPDFLYINVDAVTGELDFELNPAERSRGF